MSFIEGQLIYQTVRGPGDSGHAFALTHNLLVLLRHDLDQTQAIQGVKVEQKRTGALAARGKRAAAAGRTVAALHD